LAAPPTTVAVVGGGCSGVLAATHLLAHADERCRVALIESGPALGAGIAYGTDAPWHVLNTPAHMMSAFPGVPDDFARWAMGVHLTATADSFLPRRLYRMYLQSTLDRTERDSPSALFRVRSRVTAVHTRSSDAILGLDDGGHIEADRVVLALGNLPPTDPHPSLPAAGPRYIADPWAPRALATIEHDAPVLLVGSGLTAVDVALSLAGRGHRGPIDCVSRHGLLPRPHAPGPAGTTERPPAVVPAPGLTTRSLVASMRRAVRDAEARGEDWRPLVDGLRPLTQQLWRSLSEEDRRRFLRRAARLWEVHRHRMAPAVAASVEDLVASGRLVVRAGRLASVAADHGALRIGLRRRDGRTQELRAGHVVNCTGPSTDVRSSDDPLPRALLAAGHARPDPLALGLDVTDEGAVVGRDGTPSAILWTLGSLCRGRLWESTAVPEIRDQACGLATTLVGEQRSAAV
jgi:uncharacterized NAD(P)/FAD-binding protein YdhS